MLQNVMTFDGVGFDVGCNYGGAAGGAVTICLTRRGQQILADEMDRADSELQYTYSDSEKLETPEMPALFAYTPFMSSDYLLTGINAHSGIWLTDYSGWTLKFRATYLAGDWQPAYDAMTELLASAEPARTHLSNCAQDPEPVRDGRRIEEQPATNTATMIVMALKEMEGAASLDELPIWCAYNAFATDTENFVVWRSRDPQMRGRVDRITTASGAALKLLVGVEGPGAEDTLVEAGINNFRSIHLGPN